MDLAVALDGHEHRSRALKVARKRTNVPGHPERHRGGRGGRGRGGRYGMPMMMPMMMPMPYGMPMMGGFGGRRVALHRFEGRGLCPCYQRPLPNTAGAAAVAGAGAGATPPTRGLLGCHRQGRTGRL